MLLSIQILLLRTILITNQNTPCLLQRPLLSTRDVFQIKFALSNYCPLSIPRYLLTGELLYTLVCHKNSINPLKPETNLNNI